MWLLVVFIGAGVLVFVLHATDKEKRQGRGKIVKVRIKVVSSSGGDMGTYEGTGSDELDAVIDALQNGDDGASVSLLDGDRIDVEVIEEER